MMQLWREKRGDEATYLCLAEGLESLELRATILYLLDLFSERKQQDRASRTEGNGKLDVPRLGKYNGTYSWAP